MADDRHICTKVDSGETYNKGLRENRYQAEFWGLHNKFSLWTKARWSDQYLNGKQRAVDETSEDETGAVSWMTETDGRIT